MRLLLDENLSHRLVSALEPSFPESAHVRDFGLQSSGDTQIWSLARDKGFAIVSKDDDFNQRCLLRGHPPKVVWVRLGNCSTDELARSIENAADEFHAFDADTEQSLFILGPAGGLRR